MNNSTKLLPRVLALALIEGDTINRQAAIFRFSRSIPDDFCNVASRDDVEILKKCSSTLQNKHQKTYKQGISLLKAACTSIGVIPVTSRIKGLIYVIS
eukprot:scaffold37547_cov75-Cyclotella_meneghiniana.AAC.7